MAGETNRREAQADEPTREQLVEALAERERELAELRTQRAAALDRQAATSEILRAIAGAGGDAAQALQLIAETSARLFGAASVAIQIAEGLEFTREYRVGAIAQRIGSAYPRSNIRVGGRNMPGTVVAENRQIHIPDLDNLDPSMSDWPGLPHARAGGTRSLCGTPLRRESGAIGSLIVLRDRLLPFTDEELALLQTFADQAAIAVENARLFTETQESLKQQTATAEALKVISRSALGLHDVMQTLIDSAVRLCADDGVVYLRKGDVFLAEAANDADEEKIRARNRTPRTIDRGSMTGRVAMTGEVQFIPDNEADPEFKIAPDMRLKGIRSLVGVPLLRDGQVIGVFVLGKKQTGAFGARAVEVAKTFADQAVIVIENVRLFDEVKARTRELEETLERQEATSNILEVIASSPSNTKPVFDAIATSANRLLGGFSTTVWRIEGELQHLVAFTPTNPEADAALQALSPTSSATLPVVAPLRDGEIVQIGDTEEGPQGLRDLARLRGFRAMLFVPLLQHGSALGFVCVTRKEPGAFGSDDVQLLKTFADQAVIAIQNAQSFNDTQEALEQLKASADVLGAIGKSVSDANPVFEEILNACQRLFGSEEMGIYTIDDDKMVRVAAWRGETGAEARNDVTALDDSITGRIIRERRPHHIPDLRAVPNLPPKVRERTDRLGGASLLYAPMLWEDGGVGSILIVRSPPRPFSEREIALLQTFADQAAIAIQNARLFNETKKALERQTATSEILRVISQSPTDAHPVFETIVSTAARLLRCDLAFVMLTDGTVWWNAAVASPDGPEPNLLTGKFPVDANASFPPRAIIAKAMVYLPDWSKIEVPAHQRRVQEAYGINASLHLPFLRDGACVGVLTLASRVINPFGPKEIAQAEAYRDQAMIALENARLFNETKEALELQTATSNVLKVISRSVSDAAPVFETILDSCQQLFGLQAVAVYLVEGDKVRGVANRGWEMGEWGRDAMPLEGSSTGRAIAERRAVHFPDLVDNPALPEKYRVTIRAAGGMSVLYAPMLSEGGGVGSIVVSRRPAKPFTDKEISLLQSFADQATIAIQNSRLFNETQEALAQQTATADVLKVISRSAFDLQIVLDTLTSSATKLCDGDRAAIFQRHGDHYHFVSNYGFSAEMEAFARSNPLPSGSSGGITRAGRDRKSVHIPDVLADSDYTQSGYQTRGDYRTLLSAPLLRKGEPIGGFVIVRERVRPFNQRQIELLESFADQAVIAIENVRLFEEVQEKTRDLTEALVYQTGSANILKVIASSPTDVAPVLQAIVDSACEVCDAYDAAVILCEGDFMRFTAHRGPIPIGLEKWPLNRAWVGGRSVIDRSAVHVPDLLDAGDEFPDGREMAIRMGHRTILSVPLMREGESVGAIIVRRNEVHPFADKQVELLRSFADQAVIAIENTRLFDEVRARTHDLTEALQQQTATADVLKVISRSVFDLETVLQTLIDTAVRLARGSRGTIFIKQGDMLVARAFHSQVPKGLRDYLTSQPWPLDGDTHMAKSAREGIVIHVPDLSLSEKVMDTEVKRLATFGSGLWTPLKRDDQVIGVFGVPREEPIAFTAREIELVQTFADQAVIAIENTRLFEEVQARRRELEQSLDNLRLTQDRLVQTEKLASLGQLTAGIAHEIKNPLNFVNNFASLSRELIDELKEALAEAPLEPQARIDVEELMTMLDSNLDKVAHHGKRADSIVRNMLLHSREGAGEHSSFDVNHLVEEALNLAYHGARAEKPNFNVAIVKRLDPEAGAIDGHAQELTRVLLNLVGNGFYATAKRKGAEQSGYEPTITATTRTLGDRVEILIRDNGTGIPDEVKAKMFNPFFTTKPAGEGTGLGLSLSHDIIVKQHGGTIDVNTESGAFTEFVITLPRALAAK